MKEQLETLVANMHGTGILYSEAVREFQKGFIRHALKQNNYRVCKTAVDLQMHRNTLARTIQVMKIELPGGPRRRPARSCIVLPRRSAATA